MKQAFIRTAFYLAVFFLMAVVLVPAYLALEFFWPTGHRGDRLLLGGLVMFACLWVADWITSFLFWFARISDDRWSVFKSGRYRSAGCGSDFGKKTPS